MNPKQLVPNLKLKLGDAALRITVNINAVDLPSSPDAHVYSCLQEHITKLQVVSESLKTLVDAHGATSSTKDNTSDDAATSSPLREQTTALPEQHPSSPEDAESKTAADDVMVQIRARKSEIERRISAFMERKQMEINENNVREFCNVIDCNQGENGKEVGGQGGEGACTQIANVWERADFHRREVRLNCSKKNSCARTDAVFTPYPGFKSHVKAGPVPLSVYQRLKKLEDRILELEGLSPEYFQSSSPLHKRPRTSPTQACSLTELDEKISAVKATLLKRQNQYLKEDGFWRIWFSSPTGQESSSNLQTRSLVLKRGLVWFEIKEDVILTDREKPVKRLAKCKGCKLQMTVTFVVEYNARKTQQAMMLRDSRDERVRQADMEVMTGHTWSDSRELREAEDRLRHANIVRP
ncbi:hypothetical protein FQN60_008672 [Etheostoma spectabile]|uniref:Uncharacterized protein n=1 Tax=Etheostoma spectabile TaxID=54343 RepID=A0A5J5CJ75_9PERO|nr:hypothetical protein FQN60_008672 [Etheostoma spectabile]